MISLVLAALVLSSAASSTGSLSPREEVESVARRYLALAMGPGDEFTLVSEDVHFVDRPGEIFGGGVEKGVYGKEAFRRLVASWAIEELVWTEHHSFVSGEYAVFTGGLRWKQAGQPLSPVVPVSLVLQVRAGKIVSRRDFGDYDVFFPNVKSAEAELEEKARAYFASYLARDLGELEGFLAEDALFVDPTAGSETRGRLEILASLEASRASMGEVAFEEGVTIFTGRHALFLGDASCTLSLEGRRVPVTFPFVAHIEFEGDRVVEHRRYVDHAALERQLKAAPGQG